MTTSSENAIAPEQSVPQQIRTIAVVGAGTMGLGIAQLCVQHGFPTILFDLNADILAKAEVAIAAGLGKLVEKGKIPPQNGRQPWPASTRPPT
nr:3-hydroxyacyl-CoA dehydrogenase NAD-binding domain-containing protein [Hymenobacter qilianensis]